MEDQLVLGLFGTISGVVMKQCQMMESFVKYKQQKNFIRCRLRPPLWSSGQSFCLQIQRSRVRSPALPDFLSSSGFGTGSTQPREVKLRSYLNKKVAAPGS